MAKHETIASQIGKAIANGDRDKLQAQLHQLGVEIAAAIKTTPLMAQYSYPALIKLTHDEVSKLLTAVHEGLDRGFGK